MPGIDFAVPSELDSSNGNIMHMVKPRSSEVALLMAEHARWAQREALKALYLAAADSNQAFEAARRANVAAMEALRQPNSSFPTYAERPLPGEPWLSAARFPTDPPDPQRTMPVGSPPTGVHLERLAEWFRLHPRPPAAQPVEEIHLQPPPVHGATPPHGAPAFAAQSTDAQAAATAPEAQERGWPPHRAPAPVPFLSAKDPYIGDPGPPANRDDDPDPNPDRPRPPSPGMRPPKGGTPPKLTPPDNVSMGSVNDCVVVCAAALHGVPRRCRTWQSRRSRADEFLCGPHLSAARSDT